MRVSELIDILREQPGDAEVELAIVAPVTDDAEDITVDRFAIDGVLPWEDGDDESSGDDDTAEGGLSIWLVGGEDADVDVFLDAIEQQAED